jgi:hypothetical protein
MSPASVGDRFHPGFSGFEAWLSVFPLQAPLNGTCALRSKIIDQIRDRPFTFVEGHGRCK